MVRPASRNRLRQAPSRLSGILIALVAAASLLGSGCSFEKSSHTIGPVSPSAIGASSAPAPTGAPSGDHAELVRQVWNQVHPSPTVEGAFEVTKRVAWALRGEGAGLLRKDGGENIITWNGISFSASRVCYPDGHIYKILTDVPATNGPEWADDDFVDVSRYVPAMDPGK